MTLEQNQKLHNFFVSTFNNLMNQEEAYLRKHCAADLSVREVHVLAAVRILSNDNKNTMANIAKFLTVSPGSLTTAVNTLVNKNYLERSYTPKDRRVVFIHLTYKGDDAVDVHTQYHRNLVKAVGANLSEAELDTVLTTMEKVCDFCAEQAKTI